MNRVMGIAMILTCCVAGMACVTYAPQPVYTQPPVTSAAPAAVSSGAEDEPFYEDLSPYGQWVYASGPGWVWSPYDTPAGWRPYQLGHWVYTDYGWTWASDESFGWAVYHYGRWCNDPSYGWVWVPGTEWGPAWVAWHEGNGWVGWAPLPYQVGWQAGVGLDWGGVNINVALGPSYWHFVQAQYMVDPGMQYRLAPPARNVTLIQNTQNVTNYIFINNHVVDHGVKVDKIGRAVGHPIPHYRVRETDAPEAERGGRVKDGEFVVFRPNGEHRGRSQGRTVPPGHEGAYQQGRHRQDDGQADEDRRDSDQGAADQGQAQEPSNRQSDQHPAQDPSDRQPNQRPAQEPSNGQPNQRPERYPNAHRHQRGEDAARQNPPADTSRERPVPPKQDEAPAAPGDRGANGQAMEHPRGPAAAPPSQGQGARGTQPRKPEQAEPQIAQPASGNGQHPKPAPSRTPPGKSKPKNSGKPKSTAPDSKESDSDKSKSDKSDSGSQN